MDVEAMSDVTKKLMKEIKALPRQVHKWGCHDGLVKMVNDMSVALPLVQDLGDDSMRPRQTIE